MSWPPATVARALGVLKKHVRPRRWLKVDSLLSLRVRDTAVVFESMSNPLNVSAAIRTCDALGVSDVHVVENGEPFVPLQGADRGTLRWLRVTHHADVGACVEALRAQRFWLAATHLGPGACDMQTAVARSLLHKPPAADPASVPGASEAAIPAPVVVRTRPRVALIFGHEHNGVSRRLAAAADCRFFLPTRGFVQSLNVSVAAALSLHAFLHRTPDYAPASLRAHLLRESLEERSGLVRGSTPQEMGTAFQQQAEEAQLALRAQGIEPPSMSCAVPDAMALAATAGAPAGAGAGASGSSSGGGDSMGMSCEYLSVEERNLTMLRFLLSDIVGSRAILERAGVEL